jgi:hypothetical protein
MQPLPLRPVHRPRLAVKLFHRFFKFYIRFLHAPSLATAHLLVHKSIHSRRGCILLPNLSLYFREGNDSGIRCQRLNPVNKCELSRLLTNTTHCLQEKFDGRWLMVRKQGDTVTGINRRGLVVAIPDPIREAV